jgi:hypothetical protein
MTKSLFTLIVLLFTIFVGFAQTTEEMQAMKEEKAKELATLETQLAELTGKVSGLKTEVAALTDKLTPYPRWNVGALGTVGLNFTGFNDWLQKQQPNTTASTIGLTLNSFANLQQEKYFWRNGGGLNLSWLKFDNRDIDTDNKDFQVASDALNLSSLYGLKLSEKFAASALGEYRTSVLDGKFNDPGYLDIGVGATWTPIQNMVVVFHPLNYNFVFSSQEDDFTSSLGTKIVADYTQKIGKNIAWRSNLSTFLSYKDLNELSNWTFVNSFSTAYKGIGVGFELGLRGNKQEANLAQLSDNPLQSYYVLGLTYSIAK